MPRPKLLQLRKNPRQFNKCTSPLEDQQVNNVDRCPGKHARYKKKLERPLMNQLFIQTSCVGQMANRKNLNNKPCVFQPRSVSRCCAKPALHLKTRVTLIHRGDMISVITHHLAREFFSNAITSRSSSDCLFQRHPRFIPRLKGSHIWR